MIEVSVLAQGKNPETKKFHHLRIECKVDPYFYNDLFNSVLKVFDEYATDMEVEQKEG